MKHKNVRQTLVLLALALGITSGCSEAPNSGSQSDDTSNFTNNSKQAPSKQASIDAATLWQGEAKGYITSGEVEGDRIEVLLRLGKVLGAVEAYGEISNQANAYPPPPAAALIKMLAGAVNREIISLYESIDPLIQKKEKIEIVEVLRTLAQAEQMADFVNFDAEHEDRRRAAKNNVSLLKSRLESAVLALFASRHEFLLASSAINRQAGDMIATAVSAEGTVLDIEALNRASAMMLATRDLDPRNFSYCDAQRIPMKTYKEAVYELATQKLWAQAVGDKLSATAEDVYKLAAEAQEAGERFPVKDSEKCS